MRTRLILVVVSLVVTFGMSVATDRVIGAWSRRPSPSPGLIFPPNVAHRFKTSEFAFRVTTNSLGFRDRDFATHKTARVRILALGDSFTYGWGVEFGNNVRSIDLKGANLSRGSRFQWSVTILPWTASRLGYSRETMLYQRPVGAGAFPRVQTAGGGGPNWARSSPWRTPTRSQSGFSTPVALSATAA